MSISESIEITLSDHDFCCVAKEAHMQDITINQMFIQILKESLEKHGEANIDGDNTL